MSAYDAAVAAVRAARSARDAARDRLYALQLRGLELSRALQTAARGHGAADPAIDRDIAALEAEQASLSPRLDAIAARLAQLDALVGQVADVALQVAGADAQSAQLAAQAVSLGEQLASSDAPPAQREQAAAALRRAQLARAELEHAAEPLRRQLSLLQAQAAAAPGEQASLKQAARDTRAQLARGREQLALLQARAAQPDLPGAAQQNAGDLDAQRAEVARLEQGVRDAVAGVYGQLGPEQLIASWDDGLPILLLPLRLETRWKTAAAPPPVVGAPPGIAAPPGGIAAAPVGVAPGIVVAPPPPPQLELWVRLFPDDVAVATHEKVLTDAEVEYGEAYWTERRAAATDQARTDAWNRLATRFGANRAAWVARDRKPTNFDAALADPSLELDFPPVPQTKPDSWTEAPHTRVLPDRFVLLGFRGGELVVNALGAPVDDVVVLGPAPLQDPESGGPSISRDPGDGTLQLGPSFAWVRDFQEAVRRGLGFRVPVDPATAAAGLDELLVLGVRLSADESDGRGLVEDLIDDHHYAREGFALVAQGTPTNNTGGNDSGFTRSAPDATQSQIEVGPPLFDPVQDRTQAADGQRLADFLGIVYEPLLNATGADLGDNADAVAMNRALYAGTLGYYLDHMLDEVLDEGALPTLRHHFTDLVTGRGPIPAIRVGPQPYGILPTSAFGRWKPTPIIAGLLPGGDTFESVLLRVLQRFDQAWSALLPQLTRIGAPGDGAAHLLDVLGLHPTSEEFYQRVGYSWDTLRNMEQLVWPGGNELTDVLKLLLEGAAVRQLLLDLGYQTQRGDGSAKPLPLLLQLIWRHFHTLLDPTQLIDGQPFSETALIKPFDAAGLQNYIDWLLENGSNAAALEAQDFGGAAPPSSLLYMLLRFSVAMEAARAIRQLLAGLAVQADELVRSRKFLNVGAQPTPSTWEVFAAPASSIAPATASASPLLELVHAPQHSADAGQGLAEQRAALARLRGASTARLERALVEHVDTLGYRLDAWETSLFTRRLERQRVLDATPEQRRLGVYLGAYGYLENARPAPGARRPLPVDSLPAELQPGGAPGGELVEQVGNGGFVHAPSLNHAAAAALLRNGYLTHASPGQPDTLAVNISSDRVRRALSLLEGIRNGQELEVLLGAAFERGLHDWTTRPGAPVILDQLKPLFRLHFPIKRTRIPQAADAGSGTGASTITEDFQVTNGLDLAQAGAFPWGIPELTALSAAQQQALQHEQEAIADALDALRDVLTTEAAYQLALGNFDRASAVTQSAGSGTLPPDIQVLDTPRATSQTFTNRLAIQFGPAVAANPWPAAGSPTPRALLEPALNAWLGSLIPDPDRVACTVQALAADGSVLATGSVTLADLGLQPIDIVFLVRSQPQQSSVAELEGRIRLVFARANGISDDAVVRIAFGDAGGADRSFAEVLPLAERLRRLLGACRTLDARHFQSVSRDAPQPPDNPGRLDMAELRSRVGGALDAVRKLFRNPDPAPPVEPLERVLAAARVPGAPPAAIEALRAALLGIADAGFVYALPLSAVGTGADQLAALGGQADSVLARFDALAPATDAALADIDGGTHPADQALQLLTDVARGWLGGDFLLIPRFTFIDVAAVTAADAARDALLDNARAAGSPLPVDEWLHGAACVRARVHGFEIVRVMAEAVLADPLTLSPIQLPFRTGDSWLGVQFPETIEVVHDTVAVVQHLPQGFDPAAAQSGLLVDEWGESVPDRTDVTGLTFNYDAPDSAPPQALLLAVTPEETGSWSWDDLVETVRDTFRRARLRAVEPDQVGGMPGIGTLLPAVVAEFSTGRSTVSLDYSFVWQAIREQAAGIGSRAALSGGGA